MSKSANFNSAQSGCYLALKDSEVYASPTDKTPIMDTSLKSGCCYDAVLSFSDGNVNWVGLNPDNTSRRTPRMPGSLDWVKVSEPGETGIISNGYIYVTRLVVDE